MVNCTGCNAEEYTTGSIDKKGQVFKYLRFDKQNGIWWCNNCYDGFAKIIYDNKEFSNITIITDKVIIKNA